MDGLKLPQGWLAARAAEPYQVILLGADTADRANLQLLIQAQITDLGLEPDAVRFYDEATAHARSPKSPTMAVYFGASNPSDTPLLGELEDESIVVAPLVSRLDVATEEVPARLRHVHAIERGPDGSGLLRLATLTLEMFRLLRRERRIFISYRRVDSQPLAERLYDALDARGFDVFIDVRSVPPATDFQSVLWHRMSDSDVVILIDTPGFRDSRWTTQELARANATNIKILHLLWPGQPEDEESSLSHYVKLQKSDFWTWFSWRGRWVKNSAVLSICNAAELLRADAIAWRYRHLVDSFCDTARDLGLHPAVQPDRWIVVDTPKAKPLVVVPAVGVPTSDRINEISDSLSDRKAEAIWVIYDSRGVLNAWLSHLEWLDEHLPIRTVQMARVPERLRELTT